jgi:hypothetical protein
VRPNESGVGHDPASRIDLIRDATGPACVRLWARVVLQVLADIDAGLRVLRAGPAAGPDAARSGRMRDAHASAAWLFGPAAWCDRAWVCGRLDLEPGRLQAALPL